MKKLIFPILVIALLIGIQGQALATSNSIVSKEGYDFSTQFIGNSWDMSEFSDISQYLNQSGQANVLQNINTSNGVFSATSTSTADAHFFPLFPGYQTAIIENQYPINSQEFQCFYTAMKIDSPSSDWWQIFWFEDEKLNSPNSKWGFSSFQPVVSNQWQLYFIDLRNIENSAYTYKWQDSATWKGLRIDPSVLANTNFQVDWVRLTNCNPETVSLNNLPENQLLTFYLKIDNREISIEEFLSTNGSYSLDIQGIQPEAYEYIIKNTQNVTVQSGNLDIKKAPTAEFLSPSFTSGDSYGEEINQAWDMNSSSDIYDLACSSGILDNDLLSLTTVTGSAQPSSCTHNGIPDPRFNLNVPTPIDTTQYRYLNYNMNSSGMYQNVPEGYITRLVWSIQGTSGRPGYYCHLVSQDIPFDVGKNTYSFDLFDTFTGLVEERSGECPSGELHWQSNSPALLLRFDPNENITGETLYQEIDWLSLNKMDSVKKGDLYRIKVEYNKLETEVNTKHFYYTSNLSFPKQNFIGTYSTDSVDLSIKATDNFMLFLPLVLKNYFNEKLEANQIIYNWDTSNVPSGEYYICTESIDNYDNSSVFCSPTPVLVN